MDFSANEPNISQAVFYQTVRRAVDPSFPLVHPHSLLAVWAVHEDVFELATIQEFIALSDCSAEAAWYAVFGYALLLYSQDDTCDLVKIATPQQVKLLVDTKILPSSLLIGSEYWLFN